MFKNSGLKERFFFYLKEITLLYKLIKQSLIKNLAEIICTEIIFSCDHETLLRFQLYVNRARATILKLTS